MEGADIKKDFFSGIFPNGTDAFEVWDVFRSSGGFFQFYCTNKICRTTARNDSDAE